MDLIQALILSIVEGISEFLPISSTGHLVLTSNLLGISQSEFVKSFEVFIQLGAILGVAVLYWKRLLSGLKIWRLLLVSLLPTLVVGLMFYQFIKTVLLGNVMVTVLALGLGGGVIILIEKYYQQKFAKHEKSVEDLSWKQAFMIGVGQSISVIPGVSRAAATIFGGMMTGLSRKEAVEFSFLLAVPTMMAATGLDLFKSAGIISSGEIGLLMVGFLGAFVTSIVVIKWLVKYVGDNSFVGFGVYRIIFSGLYWLLVIK